MGWEIGFDNNWNRDIGYGVPSICDFPGCNEKIDRGLSYVCGDEPKGGEHGCGLYFCSKHFKYKKPRGSDRTIQLCPRCYNRNNPYIPKPDCKEWIEWKLKDKSWERWRKEYPNEVKELKNLIKKL